MKHITLLFFTFFLAACGSDISSGSQGVGQQCFFPSDCSAGLSCYNRVCAPIGGGVVTQPDAGTDTNTTDTSVLPDMTGFDCRPGETRCIDEQVILVCVNGQFQDESCEGGSFCSGGECVFNNRMCEDNDGDGYGIGCDLGDDCDDNNALVNNGRPEVCGNRLDDNCNDQVDEDCGECCEGGCNDPDANFCNNSCECVLTDPRVCEFQEQPCSDEGSFNNGFLCASLNDNAELRCYGLCDKTGPDPDSTCPEAGSICTFGGEDQGICLTGCNGDTGCNSAGNGCLKFGGSSDEGICTPINPRNSVGDACDSDVFFDCEENSYCLDQSGNGRGVCVESCRPFAFGPGGQSDCATGNCLPLSSDIGLCTENNGNNAGDRCRDQNTSCGEDAVGCYQGRCQRLCRLNLSGDCLQGESCQDFGGEGDLGFCQQR